MFGYRNEGVLLGHASSAGVKLGRASLKSRGNCVNSPQECQAKPPASVINTTLFLPFDALHSFTLSLTAQECCTLSLASLTTTFSCYQINPDCVRRF